MLYKLEVINIFHIERSKVENGCDCWGRLEYDDVYEVYYNDKFVCRMSSDPTVLINKMNDILIIGFPGIDYSKYIDEKIAQWIEE